MSVPSSIHLVFGNQPLRLNETADALLLHLLENEDPETAYQRFDAIELLKEDGQLTEKLDHFQLCCETLPFLSDRIIVRLDHLEKLKSPPGKKSTEPPLRSDTPTNQRLYYLLLKYLFH